MEGEKNQVGIAFEDNRVERTENTVSYYGDDVETYEFNIDGFIRLDYAPLWFLMGLTFEFMYKAFLL